MWETCSAVNTLRMHYFCVRDEMLLCVGGSESGEATGTVSHLNF